MGCGELLAAGVRFGVDGPQPRGASGFDLLDFSVINRFVPRVGAWRFGFKLRPRVDFKLLFNPIGAVPLRRDLGINLSVSLLNSLHLLAVGGFDRDFTSGAQLLCIKKSRGMCFQEGPIFLREPKGPHFRLHQIQVRFQLSQQRRCIGGGGLWQRGRFV